jgi:hypothetical protein
MRMLPNEVRALVQREGVVARKHHPELTGTIDRLVRSGELVAVLPGVYSTVLRAPDRRTRVLALASRHPDAVLVEHTAAQLSFWPEARGDQWPTRCGARPTRSQASASSGRTCRPSS